MKFPKEAEAVRKYIRDNVKRPKALPIGFCGRDFRWGNKCPLGMCPQAIDDTPTSICEFTEMVPFSQKEMRYFFRWFDGLTDPQYAVDTVWGEE